MDKEKEPKMERSLAKGVPVFIRSTQSWIFFGKYTRWSEWREELGRHRTVWTETGWAPEGTPCPRKYTTIDQVDDKLYVNFGDKPDA